MIHPKPLLDGYVTSDDVEFTTGNATEFWLGNSEGDSYFLKWWGNGWVVKCGLSYLCKDMKFKHESEIVAFNHSHYGPADSWQHIFQTKEEAAEHYRVHKFPVHAETEAFYNKVYDILVNIGGAPDDQYRRAFIFNFSKREKFPDREWRFQGKLGFGGKYRNETNRVDCYREDETPERLKLIEEMNIALKKLEE